MNIENQNHKFNPEGPGKIWTPEKGDKKIFKSHISIIGELLSDSHYDVFVRYGYAKALAEGYMGGRLSFLEAFL